MSFKFSKQSQQTLNTVRPDLIKVTKRALQISKVDFGIPETGGRRTAEEQRQLFKEGKSELDGYYKESYHQHGKAIDFFAIDPNTGEASWDPALMAQVACAFFQAAVYYWVPIEWGGLWKMFEDMPHIQLVER